MDWKYSSKLVLIRDTIVLGVLGACPVGVAEVVACCGAEVTVVVVEVGSTGCNMYCKGCEVDVDGCGSVMVVGCGCEG